MYASLAGFDLAAGATPKVTVQGALFGNDSAFWVSTANFDKMLDFKNLSAAQVIQMFPDFRDYLESEVQNSSSLLSQIPFVQAALNQVLTFADVFDEQVYSKIDFNRPRVDLLDGVDGAVAAGQKSFASAGAAFTSDMAGQYVSFLDGGAIVSTYRIQSVTDAHTLQLMTAPQQAVTNQAYVVHRKLEKLQTLQELTTALNAAQVLPAGLTATFDPATSVFAFPLAFTAALPALTAGLDFGFDFSGVELSTAAQAVIQASIDGGVSFFVDLDGQVEQGTGGSMTAGSDQFTSQDFTSTGMTGPTPQATGVRIVADQVQAGGPLQAGHVVVETFQTLTIDQALNAGSQGYIDARVFADDASIHLAAGLLINPAVDPQEDDPVGWVRLTAADGSIINDDGSTIIAPDGHVIFKAKDAIGTSSAPILTQAGALTAATATSGQGDIFVVEADDLQLVNQGHHDVLENPGLMVPTQNPEPKWLSKATWIGSSAGWLAQVRDGDPGYALASGNGVIDLTLTQTDALLTLQSGGIAALTAGTDIRLKADDLDLISGANQIQGAGQLLIRSTHDTTGYRVGSAAQLPSGDDRSDQGPNGYLDMSMRDVAAIGDNFSLVTIGHRYAGNQMWIGDVKDAGLPAAMRDDVVFQADWVTIQGDAGRVCLSVRQLYVFPSAGRGQQEGRPVGHALHRGGNCEGQPDRAERRHCVAGNHRSRATDGARSRPEPAGLVPLDRRPTAVRH